MFPHVPPEVTHVVVLVGICSLVIWWLMHIRSGVRGFVLTAIGCGLILILGYGWGLVTAVQKALQVSILPVALAFFVTFLLVFALVGLLHGRRSAQRVGHLMRPQEAKCPSCKQRGFLHEYEVQSGLRGRMIQRLCSDCAARKNAQLRAF